MFLLHVYIIEYIYYLPLIAKLLNIGLGKCLFRFPFHQKNENLKLQWRLQNGLTRFHFSNLFLKFFGKIGLRGTKLIIINSEPGLRKF